MNSETNEVQGEALTFTDFNFKLAVIQVLMFDKELIKPKFNLREFAKGYTGRKIDVEVEGYSVISEVVEYFEELQISASLAPEITELHQEGGDNVYMQLCLYWDGADPWFNIKSAEDAKMFPNLKKVVLFYEYEPIVKSQFEVLGIHAEYL